MITQKQIIIRHLQEMNKWVPAYHLRGVGTSFGFIGHQGDRRCRELVKEGKLQHKIEGGFAWYRAMPVEYQTYRVVGDRGETLKVLRLQLK